MGNLSSPVAQHTQQKAEQKVDTEREREGGGRRVVRKEGDEGSKERGR